MNRVNPGLRLSSQKLPPTCSPKCMLSVYATVVHLVTQYMCFLQLTWTGSIAMMSKALQLHSQELLRQLERKAELAMWSSFTLPPCAALRRNWLWNCQLEVLCVQFRKTVKKYHEVCRFQNFCCRAALGPLAATKSCNF